MHEGKLAAFHRQNLPPTYRMLTYASPRSRGHHHAGAWELHKDETNEMNEIES